MSWLTRDRKCWEAQVHICEMMMHGDSLQWWEHEYRFGVSVWVAYQPYCRVFGPHGATRQIDNILHEVWGILCDNAKSWSMGLGLVAGFNSIQNTQLESYMALSITHAHL